MNLLRGIFLAAALVLPGAARAQFAEQAQWGGTAGGTANALTVSIPNITSFGDLVGVQINFVVPTNNTGASTVAVGGLSPVAVLKASANGLTALTGNEMPAAAVVGVRYDGIEFVLVSGGFPAAPPPLSAPETYYVSTAGSDSNNCLTSPTACATIQHAIALAQSVNMNGFNITINVGAGSYAPFVGGSLNGSGNVIIVGDAVNPTNVLVHAVTGEAVFIQSTGYVLSGLSFQSDAAGSPPHEGDCLRASAAVEIQKVSFGSCFSNAVLAEASGTVGIDGTANGVPTSFINFTGNAPILLASRLGGQIILEQPTLNITTSITVTSFVGASSLGQVSGTFSTKNVTGTVTGQRYFATLNGVINTNGAGSTYFPGTVAGSTTTGGQYN